MKRSPSGKVHSQIWCELEVCYSQVSLYMYFVLLCVCTVVHRSDQIIVVVSHTAAWSVFVNSMLPQCEPMLLFICYIMCHGMCVCCCLFCDFHSSTMWAIVCPWIFQQEWYQLSFYFFADVLMFLAWLHGCSSFIYFFFLFQTFFYSNFASKNKDQKH
jgi:hypothetical protein